MFYRRKIILALLEEFGNNLKKTEFEKYLFLVCQEQIKENIKPSYFFVPYRYGCFSFQSYFDIRVLSKSINVDDSGIHKIDNENYLKNINTEDAHIIKKIRYENHNKKLKELIRFVYTKYPYYAINSEIAGKYLSEKELENVYSSVNKKDTHALFTIGYEGTTIEEYINKLIKNNVKLVCDVRKNPMSMKYGFSKSVFKDCLNKLNIEYIHIPELGIGSDKRASLNNQSDYDALFVDYKNTVLSEQKKCIDNIFELFLDKKRIALTCFEKNPKQCHRTIVKDAVTSLDSWNILLYEVKDI